MEETEKAYIAGFIDADGSISILKDRNCYKPIVTISNCDKAVLEYIKGLVDSGSISTKKPRKINHRVSYSLAIVYNKALELLNICLPYLRTKLPQAQAVLKWKTVVKINGKYTIEELNTRNSLIKEVHMLNTYGKKGIKTSQIET